MELSTQAIINIILILLLGISYFIYKHVQKKNLENPAYQARLREQERLEAKEARRQAAEDQELSEIMSREDYSDEDDGYEDEDY